MRFSVPARVLVAVTALVLTPVPATHAATVADCQASIAALRTTTSTTTFLGQNAAQDKAGLLAKLDAAAAALAAGKPTDASLSTANGSSAPMPHIGHSRPRLPAAP